MGVLLLFFVRYVHGYMKSRPDFYKTVPKVADLIFAEAVDL